MKIKNRTVFSIAFILCITVLGAQNNRTITIGDIIAESGEKVTGKLIIEDGVDEGTFIPLTIINGTKPGPVFSMFAGIHGTEYVPIIALQKLVSEIEPGELSGTLILVHVANIPAYSYRNAYNGQIDNKNLNRVFPGKKEGTISERIAYALTNEILTKSDYFFDIHGGEFSEQVVDYIYFFYGCPEGDVCRKSRMLALATGNKYLIPQKYDEIPDSIQNTYSDVAAFRLGVVSITNEWGDQGIVDPDELKAALKGVVNVLRTVNMLEGEAFINKSPVFLMNQKNSTSNYDGVFYPLVDKAQFVTQGMQLGYLTDYWGKIVDEYHSPYNGIVVKVNTAPAVKKGENVIRVAEVSDRFDE